MNTAQRIGNICSSDVRLPEPERAAAHLRAIMLREGAAMGPGQFIDSVAQAFKIARNAIEDGHDAPRFQREPSHQVFQEALRHAAGLLPEFASVLVLGCGDSLLGCEAAYAMETIRQVIPQTRVRQVSCLNLSRCDLVDHNRWKSAAAFDLVVSHSFLHFIADLPLALRMVVQLVGNARYYLMAHEPNARFWRNGELVSARKRMIQWRARRGRWAARINPLVYAAKLKAVMGYRRRSGFEESVNEVMAQRYGLNGGLSWREIAQLTDPHRPSEAPGEFRIGLDGLDPDSLASNGFDSMSLLWERSYNHLGPTDYLALARRWQRLNEGLHASYPFEGACWTALWRRTL